MIISEGELKLLGYQRIIHCRSCIRWCLEEPHHSIDNMFFCYERKAFTGGGCFCEKGREK